MSESINWMSLVYIVAVLLMMLPAAIYVFTRPTALRNFAIWVALFAALVWGYHYFVEVPKMEMPASEQSAPAATEENESPVRNL